MPYDCYQDFDCKREPTEQEIKAIYDWIKGLGGFAVAACTDRKPIDEEAIVTKIAADLDEQQEHLRKGMRYISLSNLYNACAPETDMVRYRQGGEAAQQLQPGAGRPEDAHDRSGADDHRLQSRGPRLDRGRLEPHHQRLSLRHEAGCDGVSDGSHAHQHPARLGARSIGSP